MRNLLIRMPGVPSVGSLIKAPNSNHVNLVIRVEAKQSKDCRGDLYDDFQIQSVRHMILDNSHRLCLDNGSRIRPFMWYNSGWKVVEEYILTRYDNTKDVEDHLKFLEGKNLYYQPPEVSP